MSCAFCVDPETMNFYILIIVQMMVLNIHAVWPTSNASTIQLLGLFPDAINTNRSTLLSIHVRAMFQAAVVLSQRYNITLDGELIGWQSRETGGDYITAVGHVCEAVSRRKTLGIVGPAFSREARVIATFGKKIGIPVISYAATDPELTNQMAYPAFYRTVTSDSAATVALVKFFQRYNWTSSIIIYQNDPFGTCGAEAIQSIFDRNGILVQKMIVFDITVSSIRGNLKDLLLQSGSRIVILWADVTSTPKILEQALDADVLGPHFTWILGSRVSLNLFHPTHYENFIGMFTLEPVVPHPMHTPINTTLLEAAYQIWQEYEPETFPGPASVDPYALFAFDATWSLILSLQSMCSSSFRNRSTPCIVFEGPSFCFDRRFASSNLLFEAIRKNPFLGVSGNIQFKEHSTDRADGFFYQLQNIHGSSRSINYVPVLNYSLQNDWQASSDEQVIIWPGNTLTPAKDRPVLRGVHLRIAVMESIPYTMRTSLIDESGKNVTKLIGYIPDLIEELEKRIGFVPTLVLAPSNQTYSQIIDDLTKGVYDLIAGDVTVTAARREKVCFSSSIFDNSVRIVTRRTSSTHVAWLSFLKPFSSKLWLVILITTIYAACLILVFERSTNEALKDKAFISSAALSLWYSTVNIVGYSVDFQTRTVAGRLLTVGLYLLSLILMATYTANLASDLTISKSTGIISAIDDIKAGKMSYNRIGIRIGTSIEEYYLREISGGNRNYYPLTSREEQYAALRNGVIDVTFMDIGVAEYATNNIYCDLALVGADFHKSTFGIVTPKHWQYGQELDVNIISLRETGVLDELRKKRFQSRTCPGEEATSTAMQIESLAGLFLIFVMISLLSVGFWIWTFRHNLEHRFLAWQKRRHLSQLNVGCF